ncbi:MULTISPECIES: hypothetical protein [Cupriavidus]|uniref:hypothetical protein n=1 Tax=Cupriavidus TaxID=106589 RepID=UPI00036B0861|nr:MULTISPECIES: hypothetical protein [Cupriavidus]
MRSERTKLLGYIALCMVAFALLTVLCVTLQEDNEQRAARKIRQMDSRAAAQAAPGQEPSSTHAAR